MKHEGTPQLPHILPVSYQDTETTTMRSRSGFYLSLLAASVTVVVNADSAFLKTWTMYHSLDGGYDFVRRGQIRLGVTEADGDMSNTDSSLELTIEQEDDENLTTESIQPYIGSGLYQLKLVEEGNEANVVLTSVPACHLRRANFRDEISLVLNPHGQAVSVQYSPLQSPLAPSCQELAEREVTTVTPIKFKSKISYETSTPAMVLKLVLPTTKPPPGLKFFVKSGGLPGQAAAEANDKPTSIFQKYWYVFLIFMVLQLIGAGSEPAVPPQQQGAAAGSGGTASPRVTASPTAAAAGQRRGKRD